MAARERSAFLATRHNARHALSIKIGDHWDLRTQRPFYFFLAPGALLLVEYFVSTQREGCARSQVQFAGRLCLSEWYQAVLQCCEALLLFVRWTAEMSSCEAACTQEVEAA